MQVPAGIPVDVVLLAMVALFLVLRLRSILGKRQGFEQRAAPAVAARPVIEGRAEPSPPVPARTIPAGDTPVGEALAAIGRQDRRFEPGAFLAGAEGAFRLILTAFAAGEREKLRPLLTAETFAAFDGAIAAREAAGQRQKTELQRIVESSIEDAVLDGSRATITVRFVSSQVNATLSGTGEVIEGVDSPAELADRWSFTRDLSAGEQAWRLASASPA
jgi:predicted lipid-binding transport protein (Tim44 family)